MIAILAVFIFAMANLLSGQIRMNFFEGDAVRLFYVNVEMPPGATLDETAATSRLPITSTRLNHTA